MLKQFSSLNAIIYGISPDSAESHKKFIAKHDLKVSLLSDPDHNVLSQYGAWGTKKNYGKEYEGVSRTTFLINPEGTLAHIWHNVKAKDHAETVLQKLQELTG